MNRPGVLVDAGPLVALLNRADNNHQLAERLWADCETPLRTCEAVVAEAAHLLCSKSTAASVDLMALGRSGALQIVLRLDEHWLPIEMLLKKYRDQPVSLADACLIRCAEVHNEPRILTFDTDFEIYRWAGRKRFEILR